MEFVFHDKLGSIAQQIMGEISQNLSSSLQALALIVDVILALLVGANLWDEFWLFTQQVDIIFTHILSPKVGILINFDTCWNFLEPAQ